MSLAEVTSAFEETDRAGEAEVEEPAAPRSLSGDGYASLDERLPTESDLNGADRTSIDGPAADYGINRTTAAGGDDFLAESERFVEPSDEPISGDGYVAKGLGSAELPDEPIRGDGYVVKGLGSAESIDAPIHGDGFKSTFADGGKTADPVATESPAGVGLGSAEPVREDTPAGAHPDAAAATPGESPADVIAGADGSTVASAESTGANDSAPDAGTDDSAPDAGANDSAPDAGADDSAPDAGTGDSAPAAGASESIEASSAKLQGDGVPVESEESWPELAEFAEFDVPLTAPESVTDRADDDDENFSALDLRDRVVIMLLFKQLVHIEDVQRVRRRSAKQTGGSPKEPLWRLMTADSAFDREKIFAEAAQVYAFKSAQFEKKAAGEFIKKQKDRFADALWDRMSKLRVLPIRQEPQPNKKEKRFIFVSHDPSRPEVNTLMRELRLESFELQYAPESEVQALIAEAFPKRNEYLDRVSDDEFAVDLGTSYDKSNSLIDEDALEAEISRSSLINLFEAALVEAVRQGVSDIHIFPNPRKQIEIHFRIDGELECWHREERVHPEALLAVVKDNTHNVDRFERDSAQDGFIQRKVDDTLIRYRVSVLPVANANQEIRSESIVIRVLDDRKVITDLARLGLQDRARSKFEWAIRQPHGMVILTGPTGSGKTTTLFAAMHQVVTPKVNVLTVEDPVEYVIPGVRQIKLSHKLDLEQALRSILRHDPDVVMVGEMRDRATADLAIKLANTGHLTFSTLHTNDAPSAVSRLFKMGVEPFLIAYAINLIVAQRLLRTLCTRCKRPVETLDRELLLRLGFTAQELAEAEFYEEGQRPNCPGCGGTGFSGRRAITETMAFTDEIRRKIVLANEIIDEDGIRQQAIADGMLTLRGSARELVKQGETSVAELIRVTAGEH